ncbi:hypothetical protein L207DRAFT_515328 [Hyaloscypha variabilis F]|jgi:hypothetical protein|uniref:Uncharacterized protein n=1 Tax=Hyaloscypha variabilis (strain UAMH 11265 / GT02V1 / F) TaxID=1149755 RepID=A0A2J6REA1_HYAVF|nr:hypothetical protein L207DRAFT_515328 [Hyaloscypha variabilis F]
MADKLGSGTFVLPLRTGKANDLDEERRTKIATALHQYRETVSQHNFFLLRVLVEAMEAEPLPSGVSARVAQTLHIAQLRDQHLGTLPESVKSPRDLLNDDVRAEIVSRARLDGVAHRPVDLKVREEYFAFIQTRIAEKKVEVAEFPPADLEYLCTLVSGITGPGLPNYRQAQQFDFISSIEDRELDYRKENVIVPIRNDAGERNDALMFVWEDWEIAIAFKIGAGARGWGGSCALYCRNEDNKQWKWRYGLYDEGWGSDIYESVEEFLGFHAHFGEQTEESVWKRIRSLKGILRLR